jgi:hypothetical protein
MNAYCLSELAKLGQMTTDERRAALQATNEDIAAIGLGTREGHSRQVLLLPA